MKNDILKDILTVEGVHIYDIMNLEDRVEIYAELEKQKENCPSCQKSVKRINNYYTQTIKDLDILGKPTYIIVKKHRYRCKCGKTFYPQNAITDKYQRKTKRLFAKVLEKLSSERSYTNVAKDFNLSVNTVIRMFDKIQYPKETFKNTRVLSIDEFKGNTGGEKYNCILVDPENKKVLDILPNRRNNALTEYFLDVNRDIRDKVEIFISDMWKPYEDIAKAFFKKSMFVADKYHWTRQVIWAFENVRKEIQKEKGATIRKWFKSSKRLLMKRYKYLSIEDKRKVDVMLYNSDDLRLAYNLKEAFLEILDCTDKKQAGALLKDWIIYAQNSSLSIFEKCGNTMINWSEGILNAFKTQYTNGFIEGCNNKIKVLKRNGYGLRNFKRFRNRILHIFNYNK